MTRNRLFLLFLCVFALAVSGCNTNQQSSTSKDQDVELSFADFVLGGDYSECVAHAAENNDLEMVFQTKDGLLEYAKYKTNLPNFENPNMPTLESSDEASSHKRAISTEVEVSAFNGKIFRVKLFSSSYLAKTAFPAMYIAKYGNDDTGTKSEWQFKNATISVETKSHIVTRQELIPERKNLNLKNYENYYRTVYDNIYDGEAVTYLETSILKQVSVYNARRKQVQDSIANAQAAEKAAQIEKDREEREREKKKAQQDILNNLKY